MKNKLIFICVVLIFTSSFSANAKSLKVCLAPLEKDSIENRISGGPYDFTIKIGSQTLKPNDQNTQCTSIQYQKNIAVQVLNQGKPQTSFYLKPQEFSGGVCIFHKAWYNTWSAWDLKNSQHLCKNP